MMEKINSAETISISHHILSKQEIKLTFSEVPDSKNIDETNKETEYRSIASLVLMLVRYVRLFSIPYR
jgi:hypothetical protein